jgi:RNA polymerase sigma-70 factor, ECF subfamily
VAAGDRDDFAERIVRDQHRVFAYIATLVPDHDDAEDVFQNTCLILWRKWEEFDPRRSFFGWACGIAHNEVRNLFRRKNPTRLQLSPDLLAQITETRLQADELLERRSRFLALCLDKLLEGQRQLVERCYLANAPVKAIAEELHISPAALTMRLQRIRRTLFECIDLAQRNEEGGPP